MSTIPIFSAALLATFLSSSLFQVPSIAEKAAPPAAGGAAPAPGPSSTVHEFYVSDVLEYKLEGSCWESAPFIPPCCDFVWVCGDGGPIADGCKLTIYLIEGDGEVFDTECDSGLRFERCANGGNPVYRVTE